VQRGQLIEQIHALGQTASTETALFHQLAAAANGLGITDMKALSMLLQDGPLTAGQVATRLNLTSGAVTNLLDRLERRALVKRQVDPEDRRRVIVVADRARLETISQAYNSMGAAFSSLLKGYNADELEFLRRYHHDVIRLTQQQIAKLPQSERS
jgi:DNA-binding MarR family transcriptional regulator